MIVVPGLSEREEGWAEQVCDMLSGQFPEQERRWPIVIVGRLVLSDREVADRFLVLCDALVREEVVRREDRRASVSLGERLRKVLFHEDRRSGLG